MDALTPLPWQADLWLDLTGQLLKQRLSHALLFAGPAGVGKRHFAQALTTYLLCEDRSGYACGKCRSCVQLAATSHPNQMVLRRLIDEKTGKEKRDISIDQIRELCEKLALSSHYAQSRVAIIDPVDALNQSGINALLKTIEEPPPNTYLILISERSQALPATLRSRCQTIRFAPPARALGIEWLAQQNVKTAEDALDQTYGAPILAREMIETGHIARRQNWASEMRAIATNKRDPLGVAEAICKEAETGKEKEKVTEFMGWLLMWLTGQLREQVQQQNGALKLERLLREAIQAHSQLALNAPPKLLVESVLILWWKIHMVGSR